MQNHAVGVGGKSFPVTHSGTQAVCHSGDPGAAGQNLLLTQSSSKAGAHPSQTLVCLQRLLTPGLQPPLLQPTASSCYLTCLFFSLYKKSSKEQADSVQK